MTSENPQLNELSSHSMWLEYHKILENSYNEETDHYDFTVLDPPFESINKHPLMLLAQSGQETLLTHRTTKCLLNLKWRYIPRITYYSQILLYLTLIVLFTLYCLELTDQSFGLARYPDPKDPVVVQYYDDYRSVYFIPILVFISLDVAKMIGQIFLSDGKCLIKISGPGIPERGQTFRGSV